ncbi:phosphoribosylformylglycinamidine cyclo-ligase [Candidatus Woesearchaeota archaeon]|nr:phosphoribosylformylglycinamidine cyclo-ligase [Candidatus Woesearchaeota archaeon]
MAEPVTYRDAGVDLGAANAAKKKIKEIARSTFSSQVLSGIGSYGGLYELNDGKVLVSSADGVGTKVKLGFLSGRHDTLGQDLVNHCVNDILVMGAKPLFFLDYIGSGKVYPEVIGRIVGGFAKACRENSCVLIGGETAELPGLYKAGEYDLAGFIVGEVPKKGIIDGSKIREGDVLIGLASSGLHTNGYSLALKVLLENAGLSLDEKPKSIGSTLGDALMAVHRSYLAPIALLQKNNIPLNGLAHITGSSFSKNVGRILPKGLSAAIDRKSWQVPPLFRLIQKLGNIEEDEMYQVFNMGIGLIIISGESNSERIISLLKPFHLSPSVIGCVKKGNREVMLI